MNDNMSMIFQLLAIASAVAVVLTRQVVVALLCTCAVSVFVFGLLALKGALFLGSLLVWILGGSALWILLLTSFLVFRHGSEPRRKRALLGWLVMLIGICAMGYAMLLPLLSMPQTTEAAGGVSVPNRLHPLLMLLLFVLVFVSWIGSFLIPRRDNA